MLSAEPAGGASSSAAQTSVSSEHSVRSTQHSLLGHEWAVAALIRALAAGRATHAYLITGPAQVGKFTTALAMAQVLLCEKGTGCRECRNCRLQERRAHPDLRILERPAERKTIPIKDVHEFTQGIALRPLEASRRVLIIDGADQLSVDGSDALLKNLEEPPPAVTFLLTAPDLAAVLPTIASRCQRVALHRVPQRAIEDYLIEQRGIPLEQAAIIAQAAAGCPGWAISASREPELLERRRRWAADLLHLLSVGSLDRIRYADNLADRWSRDSAAVRAPLEEWLRVWQDAAYAQLEVPRTRSLLASEEGPRVAQGLGAREVAAMLRATIDTLDALEANANPRLALETLVLRLPTIPAERPAEPAVAR
ncbi:MAG TPA: DNA polymerase III subunit [Chloroflexota bacterium]